MTAVDVLGTLVTWRTFSVPGGGDGNHSNDIKVVCDAARNDTLSCHVPSIV